jgi:hypothetical protein
MTMNIPRNQICQAFDAMMIMPEKTAHITKFLKRPSTSCVAPAYVYIEGTHGNKFLCDYHYHYEKFNGNYLDYDQNGLIDKRETVLVDERERVKETFAKNVTTTETLGKYCFVTSNNGRTTNTADGCVAEAFVKVTDKNGDTMFFCNFHFRKIYYRYYSNGSKYEDFYDILDERYRMTSTIIEESLNLKSIYQFDNAAFWVYN